MNYMSSRYGFGYATSGTGPRRPYLGDETGNRTEEFSGGVPAPSMNATQRWQNAGNNPTVPKTAPPVNTSDTTSPDIQNSPLFNQTPFQLPAVNFPVLGAGNYAAPQAVTPEQQVADAKGLFMASGGSDRTWHKGMAAKGIAPKIDGRVTNHSNDSPTSAAIQAGWGWKKPDLPY